MLKYPIIQNYNNKSNQQQKKNQNFKVSILNQINLSSKV